MLGRQETLNDLAREDRCLYASRVRGFTFVVMLVFGALLGACRPSVTHPTPVAPIEVPETWSFDTPQAHEEARDAALAAARWLLETHPPSADAKTWIRARDFALDWIEADGEPRVEVNVPLVAWMAKDSSYYLYTIYHRMTYQLGKGIYLATAPDPDPMQAEIEGVRGTLSLYATFRNADKRIRSRKLQRLHRKLERDRLPAFILKKFGLPHPPSIPPAAPAPVEDSAELEEPDDAPAVEADPGDEGERDELDASEADDTTEAETGDENEPLNDESRAD